MEQWIILSFLLTAYLRDLSGLRPPDLVLFVLMVLLDWLLLGSNGLHI